MNADRRRWIVLLLMANGLLPIEDSFAEGIVGKVELNERSFENRRTSPTYRNRVNSEYENRIIEWDFPHSDSLFGYSYPMQADGIYHLQRNRDTAQKLAILGHCLPLSKDFLGYRLSDCKPLLTEFDGYAY